MEFDLHCAGRYLASGSIDGRVLLYDVATGELMNEKLRLPGKNGILTSSYSVFGLLHSTGCSMVAVVAL